MIKREKLLQPLKIGIVTVFKSKSIYKKGSCSTEETTKQPGLPVEKLLQPFIGIVNTELLKAILRKTFKAVDVQDAES